MNNTSRVWIVDDDRSIRWVLEKALKQAGIDNESFSNGNELLRKIVDEQPSAIISDIRMPGIDGIDLLSKLNEKQLLLKSVMVSAYGDMQNIRTAMNAGAFDFVTKPIDFVDLEATVQKTILQVAAMKKTVQALKENDILKK